MTEIKNKFNLNHHKEDAINHVSTSNPLITILVPNYRTLDVTKLCLRLLKKHTDLNLAKVIVIDNDSQDESLEYLRSLKWITLIERKADPSDTPPVAHSRALDMAMEQVDTPYVLSIHTDTMMKRSDWLPFLLKQIEDKPDIASVGSWKLESKPWHRRLAKNIERNIQLLWYKMTDKKNHALQGIGKNYYYLRSHCALYRVDLLRKLNLSFSDERENAGKVIHRKLKEAGFQCLFLPSEILGQYMDHMNHATTVLNPKLGSRQKSIIKGTKRIKRSLKKLQADEILEDNSLDK